MRTKKSVNDQSNNTAYLIEQCEAGKREWTLAKHGYSGEVEPGTKCLQLFCDLKIRFKTLLEVKTLTLLNRCVL